MCLLGLAFQTVPGSPVCLFANREEAFSRPANGPALHSEPYPRATWLGGTDLQAGGTWLGVNEAGLVVAVTNRRREPLPPHPKSRGQLCRQLLHVPLWKDAVELACRQLSTFPFAGCNLLLADRQQAVVLEHADRPRQTPLTPGLHLITNGALDAPDDPRLQTARQLWTELLAREPAATAMTPPSLIDAARQVCSFRGGDGRAPICLEGRERGTVSSTILTLGSSFADSSYWHAAGPPSRTPYLDHSPWLRQLLLQGTTPSRRTLHRIHLKGPWNCRWAPHLTTDTPLLRHPFPAAWQDIFSNRPGQATFLRRFHQPTGLTPSDEVWLVFHGVGGTGDVMLNDIPLGTLQHDSAPQAFPIHHLLRRDNDLRCDITFDPSQHPDHPGGLYFPVSLDIVTPPP